MKEIHGIIMLRIEGIKRIGIDSMLKDHPLSCQLPYLPAFGYRGTKREKFSKSLEVP